MNVDPLADIILVRQLPPEQQSAGGILLAYDADFKEDIGIVEAVGPGKLYGCKECGTEHRRPPDVKVGDKIIFSTHGHQYTTHAGKQYIILREPSIIGVFQ